MKIAHETREQFAPISPRIHRNENRLHGLPGITQPAQGLTDVVKIRGANIRAGSVAEKDQHVAAAKIDIADTPARGINQ